jgi:hypothetical protein
MAEISVLQSSENHNKSKTKWAYDASPDEIGDMGDRLMAYARALYNPETYSGVAGEDLIPIGPFAEQIREIGQFLQKMSLETNPAAPSKAKDMESCGIRIVTGSELPKDYGREWEWIEDAVYSSFSSLKSFFELLNMYDDSFEKTVFITHIGLSLEEKASAEMHTLFDQLKTSCRGHLAVLREKGKEPELVLVQIEE